MLTIPKVYLAGKVKQGGFRDALTGNPRAMSCLGRTYETRNGHKWRYWGPLALACDHGCIHKGLHGQISPMPCAENGFFSTEGHDVPFLYEAHDYGGHGDYTMAGLPEHVLPLAVVSRCLSQIKAADFLYAWIDSPDCYATYMEIGYALALHKGIYIQVDEKLRPDLETELWYDEGFDAKDNAPDYLKVGRRVTKKNELWFMMSCCDIDAEFRSKPDIDVVVDSWRKTQVKLRELEIKRRDRLKR